MLNSSSAAEIGHAHALENGLAVQWLLVRSYKAHRCLRELFPVDRLPPSMHGEAYLTFARACESTAYRGGVGAIPFTRTVESVATLRPDGSHTDWMIPEDERSATDGGGNTSMHTRPLRMRKAAAD